MKLSTTLKAIATAMCLVTFGAHAAPVTYLFTAQGDHSGTFTFDDGAASIGIGPYGGDGVAYAATSFSVDGTTFADPELALYQNFFGDQFAYFTTSVGNDAYVQLMSTGTGLFASAAANEMNGRTLADFDGGGANYNTLYFGTQSFALISLQVAPVPEPETYALMLAGLGTIGFALRRRMA